MTIEYKDSKRIVKLSTDSSAITSLSLTGLKAYYKFDEASGNIINQATSVGSTVAIANSDLVVTGATYDATGKIGTALSFDGSNDDAKASASTVADWNFFATSGNSFTVSCWMKTLNFTGGRRFLATGNGNAGDVIFLCDHQNDGTLDITVGKVGTDNFTHSTTDGWTDSGFHFVCLQYDDSTGVFTSTIDDNTAETSGSHNLTNTGTSETYLYVGQNTAGQDYWNGVMDELSIWNRVLTSDEISALYSNGGGVAVDDAKSSFISKPTNVQDNSILVEKDTANRYWFDEATNITYEDDLSASTNWAGLSGAFSYDATNDEIDFNADTSGSSTYWNLGSTLSDTAWAMRMKVRLDTFSATSANIQNFTIGLSSTNGAYNTTQDFIGMLIRADSLGSNYKSTWGNDASQNGNTSNFTRTPSAETIYLEIIRTSATGFTVNQYSDTAYSTLLESKVVTGVTATALQYVKLTTYSEAITNNMVGAITDVKVYDGATSVTPDTWTMNPTWEDNFADFTVDTTVDNTEVKGWTPNDASQAWIDAGTNSLDFNQGNDASNNAIVFDMQSSYGTGANISDTKWRLDFDTIYDSFTGGQNQSRHFIGLSSEPETVGRTTAQDAVVILISPYNSSGWGIETSDGVAIPQDTNNVVVAFATGTTYFWSLIRDGDTITVKRWSDSTRTTLLSTTTPTQTQSISAKTITGLRYIKYMNRTEASVGTVVGRMTNITMYNGAISPN